MGFSSGYCLTENKLLRPIGSEEPEVEVEEPVVEKALEDQLADRIMASLENEPECWNICSAGNTAVHDNGTRLYWYAGFACIKDVECNPFIERDYKRIATMLEKVRIDNHKRKLEENTEEVLDRFDSVWE